MVNNGKVIPELLSLKKMFACFEQKWKKINEDLEFNP